MKKQVLLLAALAIVMVACKDKNSPDEPKSYAVATFENSVGRINLTTPESVWQGADDPKAGVNSWWSGDCQFATYVDDTYAPAIYYYAFSVSNQTANTSTGWTESYRSASGGAYEGSNFAVWYNDFNGNNSIKFSAHKVAGFFINNNAYTVNSMCNVVGEKFDNTNYLTLVCTGNRGGQKVGEVRFDLAKDGKYVNQWTYVDLSTLGTIDEISFSMEGNKENTYGLVTPTYFCMDNFGAEKPADYIEPARGQFQ